MKIRHCASSIVGCKKRLTNNVTEKQTCIVKAMQNECRIIPTHQHSTGFINTDCTLLKCFNPVNHKDPSSFFYTNALDVDHLLTVLMPLDRRTSAYFAGDARTGFTVNTDCIFQVFIAHIQLELIQERNNFAYWMSSMTNH